MTVPSLIVLQPTPYCNLTCSYCYLTQRNDRRVMAPAVVETVADTILAPLPRTAAPTVVFHAGEPLAVPIAWYEAALPRLQAAAPPGTRWSVQTNGLSIDSRWIALFTRTGLNPSLSIDGPERFHDARRRTRAGGPTWGLALRGLARLQEAGMMPAVITVLSPESLDAAEEYFRFYRENHITSVSFSIDETEGAHAKSSFDIGGEAARAHLKPAMTRFLADLLRQSYGCGYPLAIREVERIAALLASDVRPGEPGGVNEQVEPWRVVVVGADGALSTFSPEALAATGGRYDDFVFGNVLTGGVAAASRSEAFRAAATEIAAGVEACRDCRYFRICGGGAPINKLAETGSFRSTETTFCRLSIQAAAEALATLVISKAASDLAFI